MSAAPKIAYWKPSQNTLIGRGSVLSTMLCWTATDLRRVSTKPATAMEIAERTNPTPIR
uniref:Uncharacterized protein n=1 Tax=Lotus japonicus TaxID=34305 RepID=I3SGY4_LOTJA|nr:unknown [Lotus japonicus]